MNNYRYRKYCSQMSNNCNDNNEEDIMDDMISPNNNCNNIVQIPANNCECGFDMDSDGAFPTNPMLAQSYVPIQKMNKVFNPEVGLKMGTIFPELVSPYSPCQSIRQIEFLKNSNEIGEGCNR